MIHMTSNNAVLIQATAAIAEERKEQGEELIPKIKVYATASSGVNTSPCCEYRVQSFRPELSLESSRIPRLLILEVWATLKSDMTLILTEAAISAEDHTEYKMQVSKLAFPNEYLVSIADQLDKPVLIFDQELGLWYKRLTIIPNSPWEVTNLISHTAFKQLEIAKAGSQARLQPPQPERLVTIMEQHVHLTGWGPALNTRSYEAISNIVEECYAL